MKQHILRTKNFALEVSRYKDYPFEGRACVSFLRKRAAKEPEEWVPLFQCDAKTAERAPNPDPASTVAWVQLYLEDVLGDQIRSYIEQLTEIEEYLKRCRTTEGGR